MRELSGADIEYNIIFIGFSFDYKIFPKFRQNQRRRLFRHKMNFT